jgi:hypothetical protein
MWKILALLALTLATINCAYWPEMMLTAKSHTINQLISNYSTNISSAINDYPIVLPPIEETVAAVKVSVHLTKIKQKVDIHWTDNILEVKDTHTFAVNSKNINITLDAHVEAKIGLLRKQKGPLKVAISQLETDVTLRFDTPKCAKGLGFDLQISRVYVNAKSISIKI